MNFTSNITGKSMVAGMMILALGVWIGWNGDVAPTPVLPNQDNFAATESLQADFVPVFPAVAYTTESIFPTAQSDSYQLASHWYGSKSWWKRNAPIVGGAGGGALVGGLIGGGKGALIGGAVGGGGGYLYKRHERHHQREYYYNNPNYNHQNFQYRDYNH